MQAATTPRGHMGFSLVELMVGMVLGLLLIAGAVSIYLATKRSYVEVEQVAALTENARFAEQILADSLRDVGFLGEVALNRIENNSLPAPSGDCATTEAKAYDLTRVAFAAVATTSTVFGCITDAFVPTVSNSTLNDVLVIKHVSPVAYSDGPREAADPNDPLSHDGVIDTPGPLQNGRVYMMTNNVSGVLFNGATPPSIGVGGEVPRGVAWPYEYEVFYVRDGAIPQLSRRVLNYNASSMAMEFVTEDVAEGVERLHLLFGVDSDNDGEADTYSDVANVTSSGNWDGVE